MKMMSAAEARDTSSAVAPTSGGGRGAASAPTGPGAGRLPASQRFDILERLGDEGTLWVVYRTKERATGDIRALKALKTAFARHSAFSQALEAAATATLAWDHSHLARLYETDYEDGTLYTVTDWLTGAALETRLKKAPLQPGEAAQIVGQIASALAYLAARGEAHGDIRPRQILGVDGSKGGNSPCARWVATDGGLSGAYAAANLSLPDVQSDAVYYLAPERFSGSPASPQSDVYALGVVLYRMLTGRVPFDGPAPLAIARRHKSDAPLRPGQWNARVSPELESLALALLVKNPSARPTAEEVLNALRTGVAPTPVTANEAVAAGAEDEQTVAVAPLTASPLTIAAPLTAPVITPPTANVPVAHVPVADDATADAPVVFDAQADALAEKRARKKHRRREAVGAFLALFWTLVSVAMLGGVLYGAYDVWQKSAPKAVQVPAYLGKSQQTAEQILQARGLEMVVRSTRYDPTKPVGTVLSGDQPAGKTVKQGREVLVTVSQGPQPMRMVDFRELSVQRARQIIGRENLAIGTLAERYDANVPRGYVCEQYPGAGEMVRPGEQITVVVSKGPQPVNSEDSDAMDAAPGGEAVAPDTDPGTQDDILNPDTTPDVTLVSRSVKLTVAVPAGSEDRQVRIVVRDQNGEETVYNHLHHPGDTVRQVIRVTRRQGTLATVRIYLDDTLLTEKRV